jgi:calcineurin-like phosphoesterase
VNCLHTRCLSPIACGAWGYCRERNHSVVGTITEAVVKKLRDEEKQRVEAAAIHRAALRAAGIDLEEKTETALSGKEE